MWLDDEEIFATMTAISGIASRGGPRAICKGDKDARDTIPARRGPAHSC